MQGFKNRRYEYEEKFVLGSGDSHSDCGTDGGTDRTGNDLVHGLRAILKVKRKKIVTEVAIFLCFTYLPIYLSYACRG